MRRAVATVLAAAAILVSGCSDGQVESAPTPNDVVAEVDGRSLRAQDVLDHLSPPDPATDVGAPVNPRRQALDAAIRVELFAHEAERRDVKVSEGPPQIVQSRLVQSVIRRELGDPDFPLEASDAEVRRYYEEHPELFNGNGLTLVSLSTLVVEDSEKAEQLLGRADGISDGGFAELVNKNSVDEATRSNGGHLATLVDGREGPVVEQGDEIDDELLAVGWSLRAPGRVGLARDSTGRYHILRADRVDIAVRTLDEELRAYVEGVVEIERRERLLQQREEELRKNADIVVDEATLYSIPVPVW